MLGCTEPVEPKTSAAPPGKSPDQIHVYDVAPARRIAVLGTVEIRCPVSDSGVVVWGVVSMSTSGGCSYRQALWRAASRAAAGGADGLYAVRVTAAPNGRIVLMVATAFRYLEPGAQPPSAPAAPEAPPPTAAPAQPSAPSVDERLQHLQELRDKGLITPEDFERRKAELLKEI